MEAIGWTASILLILCGLPQAYQCVKQGHAKGVSPTFIWMWTLGEIFGLVYVIHKMDLPLIANYFFNLIVLSLIHI